MKTPWKLALISLPAAAGLIAAALLRVRTEPEVVLAFRVGLGVVLFALGLALTLFLGSAFWGNRWRQALAGRELQEVQRDNEAARRRFLRSLDHELKNPLAGLQIELANLREAQTTAERKAAEENASRAVSRLSRLLADLRKLADLETRSLERFPVDVPELIGEMIDAACSLPAYTGRAVHLTVSRVPQSLQPVTGDRDLLGLMFYNLIENALKFTSADDAIEVRVSEDGRALIAEIADTGPGVAAEEADQIFEELYRGSSAQDTEGSGLGLALVRRIVMLHGGEVSVRSRREAPRSTVFTVRLPVTKR